MGRWLRHRPGGVGLRSEHPGITGAKGPSTSWDSWPTRSREGPWGRRSVHRSAKTASRGRFGAFVYTVATRAASGGTSSSTAMVCRRRPIGGRLPLGRENGPCASAAARLASSPKQQPTQTPEEPSFDHIRTPATSSDVPGPSRGPSGCPRRRRLTGPASTSARCIPGSVSAGQGCLPRLPAPVPGGSTRASRSAQGTTGPVWSRRPAHLVRLALPSHPARARLVCLPSARPSRPFHHGAEAALRLRVCHILPCFTPVRARGRRCACPGPHAREATPTHPSA